MTNPPTKLIAFRCPEELIQKLDTIAETLGTTRTAVILEAVRLFARTVNQRGGRLVPPYEGEALMHSMNFGPDARGLTLRNRSKKA